METPGPGQSGVLINNLDTLSVGEQEPTPLDNLNNDIKHDSNIIDYTQDTESNSQTILHTEFTNFQFTNTGPDTLDITITGNLNDPDINDDHHINQVTVSQ